MPSKKRSKLIHSEAGAVPAAPAHREAAAKSSASPKNYKLGRAAKRQRIEEPEAPKSLKSPTAEDENNSDGHSSERDVYVTADEDEGNEAPTKAASPQTDDLDHDDDNENNEYWEKEKEDSDDEGGVSLPETDSLSLKKGKRERKEKKLKALSSKRLEASQKAVRKTGVIYLSRVPPFMKPQAVRHLLEPYGEIGRIFLTPEDPERHKKRVKAGGNKKKSFTDGWVEFLDKRKAKIVAETLNAQIIGGKKGSWYHDDVWNIKYLKGFKWHHLTEQIANENAERAARMRAEIAQTTRENKVFLQNVEKAKIMETRENKLKRKLESGASEGASAADAGMLAKKDSKGFKSHFRQNEVKLKTPKEKPTEQSDDVKRVLSKIF